MSSGFVSAASDARGDDWVKVQYEVEEKRREKAKEGVQEGGKSLYEVLQANKVAKQEAFEESMKLKNQFRTLDDGEVEFLDSIMEIERAKEAAVKKENAEGLQAFRKQREAAEMAEADGQKDNEQLEVNEWTTKKKRKREKASESLGGIKARRTSSLKEETEQKPLPVSKETKALGPDDTRPGATKSVEDKASAATHVAGASPPQQSSSRSNSAGLAAAGLGLGAYSSDDD